MNKFQGLYNKYLVSKADKSPVDEKAEYFVLRLDENSSDPIHTKACRKAILTYAENIKNHLPTLYNDIINKYN